MKHACSKEQNYTSKQLLLEATGMPIFIEKSHLYMHVPFDLSLAVAKLTDTQSLNVRRN